MPSIVRSNPVLLLTGVLFAAIPATTLVQSDTNVAAASRSGDTEAMQQRNSSAVGIILGEFRTNLSDLIFIKTERYLDSGIAYAPHIDTNELAKSGETVHAGHDHNHDHSGHDHAAHAGHNHAKPGAFSHDGHDEPETTATDHAESAANDEATSLDKHLASPEMVESAELKPGESITEMGHEPVATIIKTADQDFRGFIGNLERHVKPWRDPRAAHKHTAGTELLPWYRLATYSNPNNIRMYLIGAWWLKTLKTPAQAEEALKFLDEGLSHNPNSFQIYLMKGYVLRQLERSKAAGDAFRVAVGKGLKTRPADGSTSSPQWTEDHEDQLQSAMLMDILSVRDGESTQAALKLARDYVPRLKPPNSVERLKSELERQAP